MRIDGERALFAEKLDRAIEPLNAVHRIPGFPQTNIGRRCFGWFEIETIKNPIVGIDEEEVSRVGQLRCLYVGICDSLDSMNALCIGCEQQQSLKMFVCIGLVIADKKDVKYEIPTICFEP